VKSFHSLLEALPFFCHGGGKVRIFLKAAVDAEQNCDAAFRHLALPQSRKDKPEITSVPHQGHPHRAFLPSSSYQKPHYLDRM